MKKARLWLATIFVLLWAPAGLCGTIGPTFPAPGGTAYTVTGNSGTSGGVTITYSGFDFSQFSSLWWGPNEVDNVSLDSVTGQMNFSGYDSVTGLATWSSTSNFVFVDGFTSQLVSVPTRFTVQFQPFGGGPFLTPTSQLAAGISANSDSVLQVTGDYQIVALFEGYYGGTWTPVDDLYNQLHGGCPGCVQTSFDGEFWYTPAASSAPEPGVLALLGIQLLVLVGILSGWRIARCLGTDQRTTGA